MKKKILKSAMLVLSAILLVAASVLGTLAYLAASSAVSNTFTVGNIAIHMYESLVDENGVDQDGPDERTEDGNSYQLVPGTSYVKDPAVYVMDRKVDAFLFVKVKNGISTIEEEDPAVPTMKEQMIAKGWQLVKNNDAGEELYLYVGFDESDNSKAVDIDDLATLNPATVEAMPIGKSNDDLVIEIFDKFTVSDKADVSIYEGAKVTLTAFAIQKDTFETGFDGSDGFVGYQRAWNAVVDKFPFESGTYFTAVTP